MEVWIILGVIVLMAIIIVSNAVKVVPQSETRVIERLGRFHSVLPAGLLLTSRRWFMPVASSMWATAHMCA